MLAHKDQSPRDIVKPRQVYSKTRNIHRDLLTFCFLTH